MQKSAENRLMTIKTSVSILIVCTEKSDPIELKILENTKFTTLCNIFLKNQRILECHYLVDVL
jgi:hypothetical protein